MIINTNRKFRYKSDSAQNLITLGGLHYIIRDLIKRRPMYYSQLKIKEKRRRSNLLERSSISLRSEKVKKVIKIKCGYAKREKRVNNLSRSTTTTTTPPPPSTIIRTTTTTPLTLTLRCKQNSREKNRSLCFKNLSIFIFSDIRRIFPTEISVRFSKLDNLIMNNYD